MKKKIALALAAVLAAGMVPATAFAGVNNRITKTVSVTQDSYTSGSSLVIQEEDGDFDKDETYKFALNLTGAEWADETFGTDEDAEDYADRLENLITTEGVAGDPVVTRVTDTMITVAFTTSDDAAGTLPKLVIPMLTKVTGAEEATVAIDRMDSPLKNETLTFATIVSGSTTVTIGDTVTVDSASVVLKSIIIKENVAGTIKNTTSSSKLKLKLAGEFEFDDSATIDVSFVSGPKGATASVYDIEEDIIYIDLSGLDGTSKVQLVISGVELFATDDADAGDVAEITVSGCNVSSTTLEVGTYAEYGVEISVEDADLKVIYAGKANTSTRTLRVTLKENVADSWLYTRKTTFTFDSDVKVTGVSVYKNTNAPGVSESDFTISKNVVTLSGLTSSDVSSSGKVTLTVYFYVNVDPSFEGDIVCTVGGAALTEDTAVTVAKAVPQTTVETNVNEVIIDYRQTAIGDIIITEAASGVWSKGSTLYLDAEYMTFEDGTAYEIVSGDIKIDSVKISDGQIAIKIKSESVKEAAVIKLSNLSLYMDRTLAAGTYRLYTVEGGNSTSGIGFENYSDTSSDLTGANGKFDTDSVLVADEFVKIVTAGRDQDDATFTTTVVVTIGATTMTAGANTIALDAPAYISNGYTMLPVRAVAEALSGSAQVSWDDASKTVIIFFGSRIIKMTIGSNEMIINGTATPMSAAAEITNSRTFIPLRDLGYALGLSDSKINWDDATKTATLN